MVDVRSEREEALEGVRDVSLDLLWRHAVIEGSHDHHRHIDLWEEINRHAGDIDYADQQDHQAHHDDEEGIPKREPGHYWSSPSCRSMELPASRVTSFAGRFSGRGATFSRSRYFC